MNECNTPSHQSTPLIRTELFGGRDVPIRGESHALYVVFCLFFCFFFLGGGRDKVYTQTLSQQSTYIYNIVCLKLMQHNLMNCSIVKIGSSSTLMGSSPTEMRCTYVVTHHLGPALKYKTVSHKNIHWIHTKTFTGYAQKHLPTLTKQNRSDHQQPKKYSSSYHIDHLPRSNHAPENESLRIVYVILLSSYSD